MNPRIAHRGLLWGCAVVLVGCGSGEEITSPGPVDPPPQNLPILNPDDGFVIIQKAGGRIFARGDTGTVIAGFRDTQGRTFRGDVEVSLKVLGGTSDLVLGEQRRGVDGIFRFSFQATTLGTRSDISLVRDTVVVASHSFEVVGIKSLMITGGIRGYASRVCSTLTHGAVACWGSESANQAADPDTIGNPLRFENVSVTSGALCGLTVGGRDGRCWGPGSGPARPELPVSGNPSLRWLVPGCAVLEDERAFCWSPGPRVSEDVFQLDESVQWRMTAIGSTFFCAASADGGIYCWGTKAVPGFAQDVVVPVPTRVETDIVFDPNTLTASEESVCALDSAGLAYCWGAGATGVGVPWVRQPTLVSGELVFSAIKGGNELVCGIVGNGKLYCWGLNPTGDRGDGRSSSSTSPFDLGIDLVVTDLHVGQNHMCVVTDESDAYCWGSNNRGQLGDRTTLFRARPTSRVRLFQ
jgi:Regulator of Chromosome Condensation (RCC1) repeat protein